MKLYINTISEESNQIGLMTESRKQIESYKPDAIQSGLEKIQEALSKANKTWKDITEIEVATEPGTKFTRTRNGITIANAIAFALELPINGEEFVIPKYHKEPNITSPKNV